MVPRQRIRVNANWSPVENQLRRDKAYLAWVEDDPAYRHVQVHGEPAVTVAKAGRHKKDDEKQVVNAALPYSFLEFESGICVEEESAEKSRCRWLIQVEGAWKSSVER